MGSLRFTAMSPICVLEARVSGFDKTMRALACPLFAALKAPSKSFELQALATQLRGHGGQASDVPAGMRKTRHKSSTDRIRDSRYNDRDCRGRLFRGQRGRCIDGEDYVNSSLREIARQVAEPLVSVLGKSLVDDCI